MIQVVRPAEIVQLDKNRILEIISRLGPLGADELVSRTMEDLAVHLAKVHRGVERGSLNDICVSAAKVAECAGHIGMPTLSGVAASVVLVAHTNNGAALAATTARLDRVGEASLMQIWDLKDLSM